MFLLLAFGLASHPLMTIPELESNSVLSNAMEIGDACDMCKTIAKNAKEALTSTKLEEEILEIVKDACDRFPKELGSVCNALAPVAIPRIIEKLEEGLEIIDICTSLMICDAKKLKAREAAPVESEDDANMLPMRRLEEEDTNAIACKIPTSHKPDFFRAVEKAGTAITCSACKTFMSWLENEVNELDADSIKALVADKCPNIPIAKSVCGMINDETVDTFVELLQNKVGAAASCEWMKFC